MFHVSLIDQTKETIFQSQQYKQGRVEPMMSSTFYLLPPAPSFLSPCIYMTASSA